MRSVRISRGVSFKWESTKFRERKALEASRESGTIGGAEGKEGGNRRQEASEVEVGAKKLGKKPEAKSPQKTRVDPEMVPGTRARVGRARPCCRKRTSGFERHFL